MAAATMIINTTSATTAEWLRKNISAVSTNGWRERTTGSSPMLFISEAESDAFSDTGSGTVTNPRVDQSQREISQQVANNYYHRREKQDTQNSRSITRDD